jgi:hypothetical protein
VSSLPQGGFHERTKSGRRRAIVSGVILLLLLVIWSAIVLSWGPPSEQTGGSRENGSRARAGETPASRDSKREAVPDEPASVRQDSEGGAADQPAGEPSGRQQSAPSAAPPPGGADAGRAGSGRGHAESAGFRPDPLGTGATGGDLAPVDEERVRFAAARFITAAYGYSGDDADAYNQGVGETVAWPVFYESPGSKEIARFAEQVEKTGTRSAALLTRFERTGGDSAAVTGYAYFETGEGYGRNGGLTGSRISYRQKMTLVRSGGAWIVKATEPVEET